MIATRTEDGDIVVTVAPVTHSPPARMQDGLELPAEVKRALGLDTERAWLICAELNRFVWPGPDLRPPLPSGQLQRGTTPSSADITNHAIVLVRMTPRQPWLRFLTRTKTANARRSFEVAERSLPIASLALWTARTASARVRRCSGS